MGSEAVAGLAVMASLPSTLGLLHRRWGLPRALQCCKEADDVNDVAFEVGNLIICICTQRGRSQQRALASACPRETANP